MVWIAAMAFIVVIIVRGLQGRGFYAHGSMPLCLHF
jgi:hypothetical protein